MTVKVLYVPNRLHECNAPRAATYPIGTIVRCDECGQVWECWNGERGHEWRRAGWFTRRRGRRMEMST
jgi:hypothetical protein